ncbi:MAG: hypothetical protein OXH36_03745 [Bdellovibrionales bacterium]|nr:hypothetical protein [Bdellovibrionales bacterium]
MKYFYCITFFLLLSSCITPINLHKDTYLLSPSASEKKWEKTVPTFLFGLINASKTIKAWEKCPTNWHTIRITRSFSHLIISVLTLGLYTPTKVIIICDIPSGSTDPSNEFEQFNEREETEEILDEFY